MLTLLDGILNVVKAFGELVLWALVSFINLLIAAVGAFITTILALLPGFPAPPDAPDSGVLGWLNWIIPLGPLVAGFSLFVTCWLAFLVIRIPLRWIKAL